MKQVSNNKDFWFYLGRTCGICWEICKWILFVMIITPIIFLSTMLGKKK